MASVIVTIKIMPSSPDVDLDALYDKSTEKINSFIDEKHKNGEIRKELEPIGFGLTALKILFVMDENIGSTDKLEENIKSLEGVESVETTDVRRALG